MMRSLFSGVSGLKNHQTRMDVIGNNISNVNTTGFKYSRTTFSDTLNQTLTGASSPQGEILGGTNPKQIGLGSSVSSIDLLFTDGSVQSTGKNTDLCLSGNGLFIVKQGDQTYYTRNGAFEFDAVGNYVLPGSGLLVQGWMADADGALPENKTDANMSFIKVSADSTLSPKQTSKVVFAGNLNASTEANGAVSSTVTVYDSEGFSYPIQLLFTKTDTNKWSVSSATTDPTVEVDHEITFSNEGAAPASDIANMTITITSGAKDPVKVECSLEKLTQFDNESTIHVSESDGYGMGSLSSVSIDSSGIITGVYTNGIRRTEAQVAIAQFNNASGLTKTGSSMYQVSNNSGPANVGTASALGVKITPSALEMSNVDVANEFADMIITQRGFQSNSKIITVGDEMLETVINMKR